MSLPYRPRSFQPREPKHRMNGKIRAREVRVIDESKEQLGVMSLTDALRAAQSKGMDLIEIAPNATPPVCQIMQYGKFQYEESKRNKEARSAGSKMKELQLTPAIDAHDFEVKLSHAIDFLCEDMKVRVKLRFKGRQKAHKECGFEVINKFVRGAAPYGHPDSPPKMFGDRDLNVTLTPHPRQKRAANPHKKAEPQPPHTPSRESPPA